MYKNSKNKHITHWKKGYWKTKEISKDQARQSSMHVKIELSPVTATIQMHRYIQTHVHTHKTQLSFVCSEEILKCVFMLLSNSGHLSFM